MAAPERLKYVEHKVSHIQQRSNWDCGVSCVLMLLSTEQREKVLENFYELCHEEGFGKSTWTIDLCYLLKRFNIEHTMCTINIGVSDSHRQLSYYDKILNQDRHRVLRRFADAPARGVRCVRASLTNEQLVRHVTSHGPVLLLVDSGLLTCDICKWNKMYSEIKRCLGGQYRGHYILVVGLTARGALLYRNPALPARLCATSERALQRARTHPGTDRDAVLLWRDYR